ncbi:endo-1,4-beta-xylanase [Micromonospora sp. CA-259024]|uniref:endo-1,4-beta-xylanase n=1 Tax=Micromonospora sp. CA-259024 TaxID=3239965 RepID=UPI003D9019E6
MSRPPGWWPDGPAPPAERKLLGWGRLVALAAVVLVAVGAVLIVQSQHEATPAEPAVAPSSSASAAPVWSGLRGLAPPNVRIGSAVNGRLLESDERYRETLAANFNAVTAENAMKWANLEPRQGEYDWTAADQLVEFAQAHGQTVYGHTLVWHTSVPSWITDSWSSEDLRALLREHVTTVAARYRGKVWAWDVVNEVLNDDGTLRDTIWLRKLGPSYISEAFRWAHEADPDARLFINDYGTESRARKADALLRLVRDLRAHGVPVHGVGFQTHLRSGRPPTDITGNLRRFAALGVSVAITELDVRIELPETPQKLVTQALLYQHVLKACLAVSTCESFTLWGFSDGSSWIAAHFPGYGAACLFDQNLRPKPAHQALMQELQANGQSSTG